MQCVFNYMYKAFANTEEITTARFKTSLSCLSPLVHSCPLNTSSTDAAKPAVTEETESTTTSTVSTSAPSSGAEQALSTAESTLGKLITAEVDTDHHSIQMALKLSIF